MRNMLLERKIQVEVHSARFSIKSITSSNLHMWISNLYLPRKTLNCQNRITRSLKFIFKNSSVVPRSQKPTKDHESYLSTRVNISTLMLINVVKNPLPAIKQKEFSNQVGRNMTKSYMSSMNTVTQHMESCFHTSSTVKFPLPTYF
jgi:hypothetical protein